MRNECSCATCQSYCKHMPGWFLPHEIDAAAELLGLTPLAFFEKHLTVDVWTGDTAFVLRPRTTRESGGSVSPYDPRGECSFFKDGRCGIHAAKPHECAIAKHDIVMSVDTHKATADAWRPHQARVTELLGYEPTEPEGSFTELMFWGLL